jgi:uncharacterized protein with NAD-binding domain and iron-sulfur cluster
MYAHTRRRKQLQTHHASAHAAKYTSPYRQALRSLEDKYWGSLGTSRTRRAAQIRSYMAAADAAPATQVYAMLLLPSTTWVLQDRLHLTQ